MIRALVLAATVLFWLGVGWFAWAAWRAEPPTPTAAAPATTEAGVATEMRRITPAELARHDRADDCWLALDGTVYDLSAYGPLHPAEPEVLNAWCGREASEAYRTKGLPGGGRPHSARADAMLPRYRIGTLAPGY
jgi:cytochrome b involved in lipid metabolism